MNEKDALKRDYTKEYDNQKAIIVILNCEVVGTYRNLKKLCEDMKAKDESFLSYSSLSKRRNDENPIRFSTVRGDYQIYIEKLK